MSQNVYIGMTLKPWPILLDHYTLWYANLAANHLFTRGSFRRHDLIRDKVLSFWGTNWLSRYGLMPNDDEANWLKSIFRKHRKSFSYLEHLVVLHTFLEPRWKLASVIDTVMRLKPDKKKSSKILSGTDKHLLNECRNRWRKAIEIQGTKQARLNGFDDLYAWLYRRDRDWLLKTNQVNKMPQPKHKAKVDWQRRDRETVKKLIRIRELSELLQDMPRRSINWHLNQLEHKASIEKHLKLLPLCRLFFDRYCENIFEYQIRRITGTVISFMLDDEPLKRWQVLRKSGLSEERLTEQASLFLKEIIGI